MKNATIKTYIFKNTRIVGCTRNDSVKVFASASLEDEIIKYRKLMTQYFNTRLGSHSSLLVMDCNSVEGANELSSILQKEDFVKSIERELRVKFNSYVDGKSVCVEFTPNKDIFISDKVSLSIGEFFYISKDRKTLNKFISKHNLKIEDDIKIGNDSIQAIIKLCQILRKYKDRLFIEMSEPVGV